MFKDNSELNSKEAAKEAWVDDTIGVQPITEGRLDNVAQHQSLDLLKTVLKIPTLPEQVVRRAHSVSQSIQKSDVVHHKISIKESLNRSRFGKIIKRRLYTGTHRRG